MKALWLIAAVLRYVLLSQRRRWAATLAVGLGLTPLLPAAPSVRVHAMAALVAFVVPFVVLGRDASRRRDGFRDALAVSRRAGRLVVLEHVVALAILAPVALLWCGAQPGPTLAVLAWGAAVLGVTDALDRRSTHPGAAWAAVASLAFVFYTAPLWLAPFMGHGFGHWPATLGIGLHPAATALVAGGRTALQDKVFYTYTLSGSVDARPLEAGIGTLFHFALGLLGTGWAVLSARRPARSLS